MQGKCNFKGFNTYLVRLKAVRDENDGKNGHYEAVYFPGQEVVIAHPSKNHMIGPCKKNFSKLMADNGNYVLHSGKGATAKNQVDPTLGEFKQNLVADLGLCHFSDNLFFVLYFRSVRARRKHSGRRLPNWSKWTA